MQKSITIQLNGQPHTLGNTGEAATVSSLISHLGLKPDRIAVERNGCILPRTQWEQTELQEADRVEIVQFVGGGLGVR